MFFKPQIKLYLTNLLRLSKQNEFYINILLFSTLLLPIALVAGPLILEILIIYIIFLLKKIKLNLANWIF